MLGLTVIIVENGLTDSRTYPFLLNFAQILIGKINPSLLSPDNLTSGFGFDFFV